MNRKDVQSLLRWRRATRFQCLAWTVLLAACTTPLPLTPEATTPPIAAPPATAAMNVPESRIESRAPTTTPEMPVPDVAPTAPGAVDELDPSRNVFFLPRTAAIAAEGIETLVDISRKLKADRRLKVLLIGHADELGSNEYCVAVAARRTNAVKTELLKLGVPVGQIRRRSIGCEPPSRQACSSDACVRVGHRVELQFVEPKKLRIWRQPQKQ